MRTFTEDDDVKHELYAVDEPETIEDEEAENEEGDVRPLPRERPFSLEQLVKRAHAGLGHPSNDRLARILQQAKASPEAIQIAKNLKCAVCQAHQRVAAPRAAAPPRILHVNEIVGADTVWLPAINGKQRMALNLVDWCSRFQMIIPLHRHTPGAARAAYLRWVRIFGPPTKLYVDLGKEFLGAFELGAEYDATVVEPSALEMPTQRGITERAGRTFKEVLRKAMLYHACSTEGEWQELVDITNMTCNRLMNKSGFSPIRFSPIQRVLGYNPRIPGGLMTGGYNDWSTNGRAGEDLPMRHATEMRVAAARAFHEADCCQALRNSLHAGHRPVREFQVGQTVYFWRKGTDGPKKNGPQFWRGPARVIMVAPPTTIWLNFRGFIVKAAPEQLRHTTEEEEFTLSHWLDGLSKTRRDLETEPRRGYLDLGEDIPIEDEDSRTEPPEARIPTRRLHEKTEEKKVQFKRQKITAEEKKDEWSYDSETKVLIRNHQVPRDKLFWPMEAEGDCPVDVLKIAGQRTSRMREVETGEVRIHQDEWDNFEQENIEVKMWTGQTEFKMVDEIGDGPEQVPIPMQEESLEGTMPNASEERVLTEPADMEIVPEDEPEQRGETRGRDEVTNDENHGEEEDRPTKRLRTEFLEIYMTAIERALATKTKKEILFKNLPGDQRGVFWRAIEKEIKNNLETKAYQILSPEESETVRRSKPDKIIQSRYVLTEKNIEEDDIEKAKRDQVLIKEDGGHSTKAKARHVMKGFSETDAETLETTTPQAGRESVLFGLQVMCSYGWTPGYLDFTQAFHSGDDIKREIYAAQPPEGIPKCQPRQLVRLLKTCYGLLDGPYAWFIHLSRVLTEKLNYEASAADPCLYFKFDKEKNLRGIIVVATDDLLHGGDEEHWKQMRWLNENYHLGKFSQGNGRFVGKEIKCQKDGSIVVHQPLYTEKLEEMPFEKGRRSHRHDFCNEKEISALRGVLGGLSWLAKETRPDLSGRVAILQQTMPRPRIQDAVEANLLVKEAKEYKEVGITLHPIPLPYLRVGTASDASWGNVRPEFQEDQEEGDWWEETEDLWIRHHVRPRRTLFHPGSTDERGPNLHHLQGRRSTYWEDQHREDDWNTKDAIICLGETWVGRTVFYKAESKNEAVKSINEKYLQQQRLASQGGYLTFFYDARMETENAAYKVSVVNWKSYRIKRCTVNTLSAECQAMIHGMGSLHWLRLLLREAGGAHISLDNWETEIAKIPCIAVTDSKSLYDTITKMCNTAAHIDDKRTAIDVTILKRDFKTTQGQIRWIEGTRMIADCLTKKMKGSELRNVLINGYWSLCERGFLMPRASELQLLFGV